MMHGNCNARIVFDWTTHDLATTDILEYFSGDETGITSVLTNKATKLQRNTCKASDHHKRNGRQIDQIIKSSLERFCSGFAAASLTLPSVAVPFASVSPDTSVCIFPGIVSVIWEQTIKLEWSTKWWEKFHSQIGLFQLRHSALHLHIFLFRWFGCGLERTGQWL